MKKIQYKLGNKFTQDVIDEILNVQKKKGLTPENLLKEASDKSSHLYKFFEWDDTVAGSNWRLQQARCLINEVKIVVDDKEMYAFENVSISVTNSEHHIVREYKPILEIMNNKIYREQLIKRALAEAVYWKERHSELSELRDVFDSIIEAKNKWQKK